MKQVTRGKGGAAGRSLAVLLGVATVLGRSGGCAAVEVTEMEHRGLTNCVEITAGQTRVIVAPAWAGRVSVLDFGAGNVMFRDAGLDGKTVGPDAGWMLWDGNATDVVRSDGRSQWPPLWLHPYEMASMGGNHVEMCSDVNADTGLIASKRYELSDDGRTVTYTFTVTRQAGGAAEGFTVWERALMRVGRYAIAPLDRTWGDGKGWRQREARPRWVYPQTCLQEVGDTLVMRSGIYEPVGLAVRLRAGWIAIVEAEGVMLIEFPLEADGSYPHHGGANFMPYLNQESIELEPVSAEFHLEVGQTASFTQQWRWLAPPANLDLDDPAAVAKWVEGYVGE